MQKSNKLLLEAIKSPIITSKDNLLEIFKKCLGRSQLQEKDIVVIASKVVAMSQGRIVQLSNKSDFQKLVKEEADKIFGGEKIILTQKEDIFIPWAGVDRSNIEKGYAILWPKDSFRVAEEIRIFLQKEFQLKYLGIIISDSFCIPLRRGVSGVTLGYSGFEGVRDLRGQKDLYGNQLQVTQQAFADNIATAAHLVMGESNESTPFVLVKGAPVTFTNKKISHKSLSIDEKDCLFSPIYN